MKVLLNAVVSSLLALLLALPARTQNKPPFREVVRAFFQRYDFDRDNPLIISFQKRKEGWFTAVQNMMDPGHYDNAELFWSAERSGYLPLHYPLKQDTSEKNVEAEINEYYRVTGNDWHTEYDYQRCLYFGYPDWAKDLIKDVGERAQLNDTLIEGLARAHAHVALDLLSGSKPDASAKYAFIANENKAISLYKRLRSQYPDYSTIVGNIAAKYANEYLWASLLLQINGYSTEANEFLQPGIYPDSLLQTARGYFEKLEKGSILVSSSDNDLFPLLYLQQYEHYRPDVLVLSYSLLAEGKYVAWLDNAHDGKLFHTRPEVYQKRNFDYAMYNDKDTCTTPVPAGIFLDSVNTSARWTEGKYPEKEMSFWDTTRQYHCKDVLVPIRPSAINRRSPYTVKLKLGQYLLMNDFILLDILNTDQGRHTFYFTVSTDHPIFDPHLVQKEKVYQLGTD